MTTAPPPSVGPPRGILHASDHLKHFHHARYAPSADVGFFVAHLWVVSWDLRGQPPFVSATLPHPSVHIVFEPGRREVGGVNPGRFQRRLTGKSRAFGIKFRPGAFEPFLGKSVATLTNKIVGIRSLFGPEGTALRDAILAEPDEATCVRLSEEFLRARLPAPSAEVAAIRDLVERLAVDRDLTRVEQAAQLLNTDTRQLQRLFRRYVGVSPKWVIQRYRLHEAAEQLRSTEPPDLAELAVRLGYFDQAHFARDFKRVIGQSPGQYAKGLRVV
jgi:AraC-like DNA-binding protein